MTEQYPAHKQLKQFSTAPHPCSYLPGMEASTLFVDPDADIDRHTYTYLSERGYRRSGQFLYKPDCQNCQACISLRIPVKDYHFSRNERRILKRNDDLQAFAVQHIFAEPFYRLYADYICARHHDGDMYPPSPEQYRNFLNNGFGTSEFMVFTHDHAIKAVAVIDRLDNALSAVYTFYDPFDDKRSLGTFVILWQIQRAQELGLDYVYLGYWVKNCQKMNYKTRFRPAEVLINRRWLRLL
ncbi:MAG TPA: arginyltransferase [Pseudomonadales bacterium]